MKNVQLSELVGIMYGDGCLSRSGAKSLVYISGHKFDDLEFHESVTKKLFKYTFNKRILINFRTDENTLFIRFSDKAIFETFRSYGMPVGKKQGLLTVPERIRNDPPHFLAFLRGLLATDGCIVFSKQHRKVPYYPRIEITNGSEDFLKEILLLLKCEGFSGSVSCKGRGYRLEISGFKNLGKWRKEIGFSNPKHEKKIETQMGLQRL